VSAAVGVWTGYEAVYVGSPTTIPGRASLQRMHGGSVVMGEFACRVEVDAAVNTAYADLSVKVLANVGTSSEACGIMMSFGRITVLDVGATGIGSAIMFCE